VFAFIRKSIFPVAALGTRMLRATKAIPKEVLPVYSGQIEHVVNEAIAVGNNETMRGTRRGKEAIDHYE
jgi:UTP--glucose-1-phosphate uridylyltransferase